MRRGTPRVSWWIRRSALAVEGQRAGEAGHGQAVADVLRRLCLGQCAQVEAGNHALRQLLQFRPGQHAAQLGLADQHHLQQLALAGFEVGQQAQLLQHIGREVLRLVDDQHVVAPGRVLRQQEGVQRVDVVLHRLRTRWHGGVELVADGLQQLKHGELGVEDVGDVAVRRDLLQEAAADGGLAGPDLARQQHEAATSVQPIQQMGQRLAVALTHEQVMRVRRDRERRLFQAEEGRVHGAAG